MDCNYCGQMLSNTAPGHTWRLRREDSKFCDDQCRTAYHNARRKLVRKLKKLRELQAEIYDLQKEMEWDPVPLVIEANQHIDDPEHAALLADFFKALSQPNERDLGNDQSKRG